MGFVGMSFAITHRNLPCIVGDVVSGLRSFGTAMEDTFHTTTQKIKDAVVSPLGQGVVGFGLGLGAHKVYGPLTDKIVSNFGLTTLLVDPFAAMSLSSKIFLAPFICVIGPIIEELVFRGGIQGAIKEQLVIFYANLGLSDFAVNIAARITSVFFASVIFGLVHFTNAISFWCSPILFLPQVVAATIMGVAFGLAKEFSGELYMPIGMHIGNNTLAWANYIRETLN